MASSVSEIAPHWVRISATLSTSRTNDATSQWSCLYVQETYPSAPGMATQRVHRLHILVLLFLLSHTKKTKEKNEVAAQWVHISM